jgi:cobalt-zinc-cadmium efflux system membrane fusion protein
MIGRVRMIVGAVLIFCVGLAAGLYWAGRLRVEGNAEPPVSREAPGPEERKGEPEEATRRLVEGKVVLRREELATSGIRTAAVTTGSVAVGLHLNGEVELAEDRIARITPRIAGVVRDIHHQVGDRVARDETLCTLESMDLGGARAAYVTALAETRLAERNYRRWQQLYEKGLKTQNEFWAAENEFTRARLNRDAARSKLKALGVEDDEIRVLEQRGSAAVSNRYEVKSPLAGLILDRQHMTPGEYLDPTMQIFLVADLSEVWVIAALYEKDLPAVHVGMKGIVRVRDYPEAAFEGRVTYVGQQADEKTRTLPLRLVVRTRPGPADGRGGEKPSPTSGTLDSFILRPDTFVTVDLETSRKRDVPVVPASAIQTLADRTVVFVRTIPPEYAEPSDQSGAPPTEEEVVAFEPRVVTVGAREADRVEVLSGVALGEEVAVENAYLLKSELERAKFGGEE